MIRRHEMVAVVRAGAGDLVRWENTRFESHSLRCIYCFFFCFFFLHQPACKNNGVRYNTKDTLLLYLRSNEGTR